MEDARHLLQPHECLLNPAHFPHVTTHLTTDPQQIFSPAAGLVWTHHPDSICSQALETHITGITGSLQVGHYFPAPLPAHQPAPGFQQPPPNVSASTMPSAWAAAFFLLELSPVVELGWISLALYHIVTGSNLAHSQSNSGIKLLFTVHFLRTKIREKPSMCNWILIILRSLCSFNWHSIRWVWRAS